MSISNFKNKIGGYKPVKLSKKGKNKSFGAIKSSSSWQTILTNGVEERKSDIDWQLNYLNKMSKKGFIMNKPELVRHVNLLRDGVLDKK